jgi:hypothetical protein
VGLTTIGVAWALTAAPAFAATGDRDGDGMPTRWESAQGLSPDQPNARGDADRDGLTNLGEYLHGGKAKDEDTDNDGVDDGDEVKVFGAGVADRDSDNDKRIDGEEDNDKDGIHNEDEDDVKETCAGDDDDSDNDGIADEDENELKLKAGDADSDNDGVADGNEDRDDDGVNNEDEDDSASDTCDGDDDGDGVDDEDQNDLFGTVTSYDAVSGALTITPLFGSPVSTVLIDSTELQWDEGECNGVEEVTVADLQGAPGVEDYELDADGNLEELELICPAA